MNTEYTIDDLTSIKVSVKTQKYYEGYPLGEPHRKSYVNSAEGRNELEDELPAQQVNAIFSMWGERPVIEV